MSLLSRPALHPDADPRYPIGKLEVPSPITPDAVLVAITEIADLPTNLRNAVDGLDHNHLEVPYREGAWTVRQVVHHVADSHTHAFARIRFALTEDWPTIKPYDENAWAHLHDTRAPVEWSLTLVESLHARWVMLLQSLTLEQWNRGFIHPERGRVPVAQAALEYAWHGSHHTAHITHLRARMDW